RLGDLLAAPAVSQRYCNGSFRSLLADDVLVELMHDLGRRHDERHGGLGRKVAQKNGRPLETAVLFYALALLSRREVLAKRHNFTSCASVTARRGSRTGRVGSRARGS